MGLFCIHCSPKPTKLRPWFPIYLLLFSILQLFVLVHLPKDWKNLLCHLKLAKSTKPIYGKTWENPGTEIWFVDISQVWYVIKMLSKSKNIIVSTLKRILCWRWQQYNIDQLSVGIIKATIWAEHIFMNIICMERQVCAGAGISVKPSVHDLF